MDECGALRAMAIELLQGKPLPRRHKNNPRNLYHLILKLSVPQLTARYTELNGGKPPTGKWREDACWLNQEVRRLEQTK